MQAYLGVAASLSLFTKDGRDVATLHETINLWEELHCKVIVCLYEDEQIQEMN